MICLVVVGGAARSCVLAETNTDRQTATNGHEDDISQPQAR